MTGYTTIHCIVLGSGRYTTMAETACAQEELMFYKAHVDPEDNLVIKKSATEEKMKFKSAQDTKQVDFVPS